MGTSLGVLYRKEAAAFDAFQKAQRANKPHDVVQAFLDGAREAEAAVRLALPAGGDYHLRGWLIEPGRHAPGGYELAPADFRALSIATAGAGANLVARSLPELFAAALVGGIPLLGLATVIPTADAGPLSAQTIVTAAAPPGIVADGGLGSTTDPVFSGGDLQAFRFPALVTVSQELAGDTGTSGLEEYVARTTVDAIAPSIGAQLWRGTGGGTAPAGLAVNVSTVAAGSPTTVALADVENLLAALPAAVQASPNLAIAMHPTAWRQLRAVRDSATAPQIPVTAGLELYGVRVVLDPHLQTPAAAARSIVAGDFSNAYVVRMAPQRVEFSGGLGVGFDTYAKQLRAVVRLDGRPVVTASCRALLH